MTGSRNLSGCQVFKSSDLPNGWECAPLKERVELVYGQGLREEDRKPGPFDVYGSNGKVGTHNQYLVDTPGILVGRKGTVGAVHHTNRPFWPIDTVYYIKALSNDNFRFLFHLLDYLPLSILNAATGVPGLSRRDAYALRGAFPPTKEQEAIARILDAVDTTIERTREAIALAHEFRVSLIHKLLHVGVHNENTRKSEIGLIPRSWDCNVLGKYIDKGPTNGVYCPESDYGAQGTRIVRIDSFDRGRIHDLATLKRVKVKPVIEQRYALQEGDLLINRVNSLSHIGKAAYVPKLDEPTIFESNMMSLGCDERLLSEFLILVLCSDIARRHWLARAKPAVNQASINQRDVKELPIPIPQIDEQREIARIISAADRYTDELEAVAAAQYTLKKSLMRDLLTGKVRVTDLNISI